MGRYDRDPTAACGCTAADGAICLRPAPHCCARCRLTGGLLAGAVDCLTASIDRGPDGPGIYDLGMAVEPFCSKYASSC